jgi:hypothetical protein
MIWYHTYVLNCTWDDMEAEIALRRMGLSRKDQQKAEDYLKLREDYRSSGQAPQPESNEKAPTHPPR